MASGHVPLHNRDGASSPSPSSSSAPSPSFPWPHYDDTSLNLLVFASYIRSYSIDPSPPLPEPTKIESSSTSSLPRTLPDLKPNPAPGYSIIAQTLHKKLGRGEPIREDSIDDWEMIDSESSGSRSESPQPSSGSTPTTPILTPKRPSFIERRASSHMEEVERLAVQILGAEILALSGLNLPSTSTSQSTRLALNNNNPSHGLTKEALEAEEVKNPFLRRNIRAVEIMTTEAKYLVGLEHVLKYALAPLQAKEGIESETINLLLKTSRQPRPQSSPSPNTSFSSSSNMAGRVSTPAEVYDASCVPDLSKEEIRSIFGNLESLYVTNCNLLIGLLSIFRTWQDADSTLGQLFHYYAPLLKVSYSVYLSDLSNALASINILRKKQPKFDLFLSRFAMLDASEKRPLSDFISTPLQRITRYEILLAALEKETPQTHADKELLKRASETLHKALNHINKSPLEVERRAKLLELQARFAAGETIMDSARLLILEYDGMRVRDIAEATSSVQPVFLFTDSLLMATMSYSGYLYKQHLFDLHSTVIMDRPSSTGQSTSLWFLYPMKTYILELASVEMKNVWMIAIAQAIAILVSKSPDRERARMNYAIHLFENEVPLLIPVEAQKDKQHVAWNEIKAIEAQVSGNNSGGFLATIRSWFGGASSSAPTSP